MSLNAQLLIVINNFYPFLNLMIPHPFEFMYIYTNIHNCISNWIKTSVDYAIDPSVNKIM